MDKLKFSEEHIRSIRQAISEGGDVWSNRCIKSVKDEIKKFYRGNVNRCCYCRRSMQAEFNMVIDIEHILPHSKFKKYMFSMKNLAISCKRCNMQIKKDDTSFLIDDHGRKRLFKKDTYKIIHPNLDVYEKNIKRICIEVDDFSYVKYIILEKSNKGKFTYDFFRLYEFEENDLNEAQGIKKVENYIRDFNVGH